MQLRASAIDIATRAPTVVFNTADAAELGVHSLDRVQIAADGRETIGIVELTDELVPPGELGLTSRLAHLSGVVDVTVAPHPDSVASIRRKLDDAELEAHEIDRIVQDIADDRLSDLELGAYVASVAAGGLSLAETMHLSASMAAVGKRLEWDVTPVADKHSIGGVAGNRVTPIVVAIVAAAGVTIPKTSSRAVTSAAGTADTMEVFCDVAFTLEEIRAIVSEAGGCIAWGGAVNLSPVDDKIIRAETPLSVDPPGQLVASVLSKKGSAGSTHVVIDLPYGEGAKLHGLDDARELAEDFCRVGSHLGLDVECAITSGNQPIGRGVGPVLEARDVLSVLQGDGPRDLRQKSLRLAEILLERVDVEESAEGVLDSGRADARFRKIVAAQGGDPDVSLSDLVPGAERAVVRANEGGVVTHVDNRTVNAICRRAGAPRDHGAGLLLAVRVGDTVEEGDPLYTLHAERSAKLDDALAFVDRTEAVRIQSADETIVEHRLSGADVEAGDTHRW